MTNQTRRRADERSAVSRVVFSNATITELAKFFYGDVANETGFEWRYDFVVTNDRSLGLDFVMRDVGLDLRREKRDVETLHITSVRRAVHD